MTAAPDDVATPTAAGQTRAVVLGGAVSSLAAYGFQVVGARALGDAAYAPVGILWTIQYLVLTIGLLSTEAFVTRHGRATAGVWGWIAGLAAAVGVGTALGGSAVFGSAAPAWPLTAAAVVAGFGLFVVVRGHLAAERRYRAYGVMTGGESVIRLLVAVALLVAGGGPVALAATLPVGGALVALPWLRSVRHRVPGAAPLVDDGLGDRVEPDGVVPDDGAAGGGRPLPFLARTTAANGAAQVLLAAGPLVTAALGGSPALVTVVFVTTTAARAPMVFVHSGVLARILPPMRAMAAAGQHADLRRRLARGTPPVLGALALVATAGAVVGPPLVALTFGTAMRPGVVFAALTAASVLLAMLALVLNQIAIAVDAEAHLLLPWALGLLAAGLVLVVGADLAVDVQVAAASAIGLLTATALVRLRLARLLHR